QVINQFSDMKKGIKKGVLREASSALFSIDYENYKNAVVSYLSEEDQDYYKNKEVWEEMQNKVAELMKKLQE
ncbi:hypothetical protein KKA47_02555, partial [bacterium]|nr:hypothetical protein [bacterium]